MIAERHNQLLLHRLSDVRSCWPLRHSAVRVHVYNRRLGGSYLAWHVQLQRTGNHGRFSQNSRGACVADCLSCLVLSTCSACHLSRSSRLKGTPVSELSSFFKA